MLPPVLRGVAAALLVLLAACARLPERVPASVALPLPEVPLAEPVPLPAPEPATPAPAPKRSPLLDYALSYLGVPYRYGGNSPASGFDCSGYVRHVYRAVPGLALPRASLDMSGAAGVTVDPAELAPGDLVFFRINGRRISHVGIYLGEGEFVHAPSRGGKVRIDRLDDRYWKPRYATARRVLSEGAAALLPAPISPVEGLRPRVDAGPGPPPSG